VWEGDSSFGWVWQGGHWAGWLLCTKEISFTAPHAQM
jgi:hypothetical protein